MLLHAFILSMKEVKWHELNLAYVTLAFILFAKFEILPPTCSVGTLQEMFFSLL